MIRELIAAVLLGAGIAVCILSAVGFWRFPYVLTRLHATAVTDTLGTMLICAGLIVLKGFGWASAKIALIVLFQWITSPVSTHRIAGTEISTNPDYKKHCTEAPDELKGDT